jgi:hypothetical protein
MFRLRTKDITSADVPDPDPKSTFDISVKHYVSAVRWARGNDWSENNQVLQHGSFFSRDSRGRLGRGWRPSMQVGMDHVTCDLCTKRLVSIVPTVLPL